ncbi:MAG: PbsX family transcriptional regulator [Burkholderiaceae bacterium]|nr:PbsX family transcriptional regulator [Burkholderiaceae bacterium]MDO9089732.1 PbsX family transcriptional regulator [Burkholderiaceae bacterium]MDP1967946.1 PbsX family transcriptional regulator [Burkholderiaceae bacterium]
MDSIIGKWGNSPALRLNLPTMKAASFVTGQRVSIKATRGRIVIEPLDKLDFKLEDLVAGITPENSHGEADFGKPVGREAF